MSCTAYIVYPFFKPCQFWPILRQNLFDAIQGSLDNAAVSCHISFSSQNEKRALQLKGGLLGDPKMVFSAGSNEIFMK